MMIFTQKNGLSFLQFPNLAKYPEIWHAVFTRRGGISKPPFDGLNTALSVGDEISNAHHNRSLILQIIGDGELVFTKQIHGSDVIVLSEKSNSSLVGDAIISDMSRKFLVIQTADCQSVMLYDPVMKIVANIHSGWRGSIQNIISHTIKAMSDNFRCIPGNILAGIGPSLGHCCAEFVNYEQEIPEEYWAYMTGQHHFDFWKISTDQLCNAGVPHKNICLSNLCSKCRSDLFFSYRGEKITGRFAAVIGKVG